MPGLKLSQRFEIHAPHDSWHGGDLRLPRVLLSHRFAHVLSSVLKVLGGGVGGFVVARRAAIKPAATI